MFIRIASSIRISSALVVAALAALPLACGGASTPSHLKFDAEGSIAVDAVIDHGAAIVSRPEYARSEIIRQLYYTIGQFNGIDGATEMQRARVEVTSTNRRSDGRYDATYTAKLFVAWPRERAVPESYTAVLPAGGDSSSLHDFFRRYDEASGCLDWSAHEVGLGNHWYYYRPISDRCSLATPADGDQAVRLDMRLEISAANTQGKFPEYGKVWEDGKLVVTAIFGKNEEYAQTEWDAGVSAYRSFYERLVERYGQPTASNLPTDAVPGIAHPKLELAFNTPAGPLDVHVFLVESLQQAVDYDQQFVAAYSERTLVSDFVSYSGHSGLGANIQRLSYSGRFAPNQYQIYLVNGCDTFAYVDNALRDAHQAVNPASGPNKYFDIITNAMPSYFHMNATANMAVIDALVDQQLTYRQLLANFDDAQRASVLGEEDNTWPAPFQP